MISWDPNATWISRGIYGKKSKKGKEKENRVYHMIGCPYFPHVIVGSPPVADKTFLCKSFLVLLFFLFHCHRLKGTISLIQNYELVYKTHVHIFN